MYLCLGECMTGRSSCIYCNLGGPAAEGAVKRIADENAAV